MSNVDRAVEKLDYHGQAQIIWASAYKLLEKAGTDRLDLEDDGKKVVVERFWREPWKIDTIRIGIYHGGKRKEFIRLDNIASDEHPLILSNLGDENLIATGGITDLQKNLDQMES